MNFASEVSMGTVAGVTTDAIEQQEKGTDLLSFEPFSAPQQLGAGSNPNPWGLAAIGG